MTEREPFKHKLLRGLIRMFDTPAPERRRSRPPRYSTEPAHRLMCPTPWVTHPTRGTVAPPACVACGETSGLSLMWVERAEHLARFQCSGCGASWVDPEWATADVVARLLAATEATWELSEQDADPRLWALSEDMRYEAGGDGHGRGDRRKRRS